MPPIEPEIFDDDHWSMLLDDQIRVKGTQRPDSAVLDRFFEGYDRAFVLPNEREEIDGFRKCLALNPSNRRRFGRVHAELVAILEDDSGRLLGGTNFLATHLGNVPDDHPPVAVALNYVFVDERARGRGLSRRILAVVARLASRAVGPADEFYAPALFIEQNDPLRMSPADYAKDTAHSGIDQIDRMVLWSRLGARLVDFPYVQPALSAAQLPDNGLVYAVIGFHGERMDPGYLRAHLESFFAISVLKGGDPMADPTSAAQLALLEAMIAAQDAIPIRPVDAALGRLRASRSRSSSISFREFTRAH